ncbi:toll/interleukin-1 receptor domain-containing protein [Curtobacterium sp. 9128]|uniref:toll/interleukin-1 receptor domain-containing protein n=1 Tax=Curtobacterium sp. 9128 TaxID=1793722 RepID=UPI00119CDFAC|nr:toll/interleukin-1 receptor domain-containing protein [Curtobacterium sp. 9128]
MAAGIAKHAFISYVKEDKDAVDRLCRVLDRAGVPYWRDRKDLAPGDAWRAKIRSAIRDGSLVFLACFSDQSRARSKSYMNEELTLAVDEFRQRPPGATWLIPVRFDEGEVPEWDLGAGRSLTDLNYADLFGESYAEEAAGLVASVTAVIGTEVDPSVQVSAVVAEADTDERSALLRWHTKAMLPDSSRHIVLDDLIRQETRRVVDALTGPDFPTSPNGVPQEQMLAFAVEQALEMVRLVEPLCWSMQVAGRWAEPSTMRLWCDALKSVAAAGTQVQSGYTVLVALRSLPALTLLTTGVLAAHASGRWDNVHALTSLTIPDQRRQAELLVNLVTPWNAFDSNELLPNVLARSNRDGSDASVHFASLRAGRTPKLLTPISDWLMAWLQPCFDEQFASNAEYENAFAAAETFLGVLSEDAAATSEHRFGGSAWYGRDTWRDRYSDTNVVDDLLAEAKSAQEYWAPLRSGLFGGDHRRALEALRKYRENFVRVARDRS